VRRDSPEKKGQGGRTAKSLLILYYNYFQIANFL
jgi:hypothetical protein